MVSIRISCVLLVASCILAFSCSSAKTEEVQADQQPIARAQVTLDSLLQYYSVANTPLLRETFPFDSQYTASYLASEEQGNQPNPYAYLWPYSGLLSAVNVLMEAGESEQYRPLLEKRVLPGLNEYFDEKRLPAAYSSYIRTAPASDRFYDDNVWLGIDFTDLYAQTKSPLYLEKARLIWEFIRSGMDDKLGGGIYWCEQKKESKNTCSNAPGAVYALKLFEATGDSSYFHQGRALYEWTKTRLRDTTDYLYFDHIRLDGKIGKAKYAYNSGQMIQAGALLYKLSGDTVFLDEARQTAKSCYDYFFHDFIGENGESFRMINRGDVWFTAVMFRGFIELYHQDKGERYLQAFRQSLEYAWKHARDEQGLFHTDFTGQEKDKKKWLLTQAAMIEMYARLAVLEQDNSH